MSSVIFGYPTIKCPKCSTIQFKLNGGADNVFCCKCGIEFNSTDSSKAKKKTLSSNSKSVDSKKRVIDLTNLDFEVNEKDTESAKKRKTVSSIAKTSCKHRTKCGNRCWCIITDDNDNEFCKKHQDQYLKIVEKERIKKWQEKEKLQRSLLYTSQGSLRENSSYEEFRSPQKYCPRPGFQLTCRCPSVSPCICK
jgi:hypothetical protein